MMFNNPKIPFFCFCFLFSPLLFAQNDSTKVLEEKKWAFLLAFDVRNTFLELNKDQANPVNLYGIQAGVRYKRWKFWGGWAVIDAQSKALQKVRTKNNPVPTPTNPNPPLPPTVNRSLRLSFFTLTPEYLFLKNKYLELSLPLEFGLGYSDLENTNDQGKVLQSKTGVFVPLESGMNVLVRPTRWVGLIGRAGYRTTVNVSGFEADYDGWYYNYGIALFLGNIVKDYKTWQSKKKVE